MKNKKSPTLWLILCMLFLGLTFNAFSQTFVEKHGQLKVKGNYIVDKNDEPLQLNGMSFFWSQWMDKYYNYECVKWLRNDWNCKIVRAAMGIESGGYLENPEIEKKKVFTIIDAAIDLGIYVIVDWHDHKAEKHTEESKFFFTEIAKKYGHTPNIIYEIYNEPLIISWEKTVKPYNETVIKAIRAVDPDNIIVCGNPTWSQDVDIAAADPILGENIAYTLHYYAATHKQELRDKAEAAIKKGACLFVTEYGTCEASGNGHLDYEESKLWWDFCDKYKIGYLNWSVADKVETASSLIPGADPRGGWKIDMLTPSGKFVRAKLRNEDISSFLQLNKQ